MSTNSVREPPDSRGTHPGGPLLRHVQQRGFAAVVLAGGYVEAGLVARLAKRDQRAALTYLLGNLELKPDQPAEWPDLAAQDMREEPKLCLEAGRTHMGCTPEASAVAFDEVSFAAAPWRQAAAPGYGRELESAADARNQVD